MERALFYNNITLLDFAFLDRKFQVHGGSYRVDVELVGDLDDEAMILDFSLVKSKIKRIIDLECDHRLIVSKDFVTLEDGVGIIDKQALYYRAPAEAFCLVPFENITKETLAPFLEQLLLKQMPENVSEVRVLLEDPLEGMTTFRYTHGLKKHKGNCQRLLHGHKSAIEIYIDGERDRELEKEFLNRFLAPSIHFSFLANSHQQKTGILVELPMVEISYGASQGDFVLKIPGCYLFMTEEETTIENLAKTLCLRVFEIVEKKCTVTFRISEGIGKGAKVTLSSPL